MGGWVVILVSHFYFRGGNGSRLVSMHFLENTLIREYDFTSS